MRASGKVVICLLIGALVLAVHAHSAQTWAPMFRLIVVALLLSSGPALCALRIAPPSTLF